MQLLFLRGDELPFAQHAVPQEQVEDVGMDAAVAVHAGLVKEFTVFLEGLGRTYRPVTSSSRSRPPCAAEA